MQPEVDSFGRISLPESLTRAGRPFAPGLERELEPDLRAAAIKLGGRSGDLVLLPEFPLPVGVPDLVAVSLNQDLFAARLASGIPPILGSRRASVISSCGVRRPASLRLLVSVTGSSEKHTRAIIGELVRAGAITRFGSGWVRDPALQPLGKVFALEAKVSDWRSGFAQSLRYGVYAQNVTLVVGKLGERASQSAEEACRSHGVGLYIAGRRRVQPRSQVVKLERRFQSSEQVLAVLMHLADSVSDSIH